MGEVPQVIRLTVKDYIAQSDISETDKQFISAQLATINEHNYYLEDRVVLDSMKSLQRPLLSDLYEIFDDNDFDIESLESRVEAVEAEANRILSGQDIEGMLHICSVAKHTLNYWYLSAEDWMAMGGVSPTRSGFNWKQMGKCDLKGAARGAVNGIGRRLLAGGPLGWKAWAVYILGNAVVGSAFDAYDQLVRKDLVI